MCVEGYLCEICGRSFTRRKNLCAHQKLLHSSRKVWRCKKYPFSTLFQRNLARHHALRHLRRRSAYIPRRSISMSDKKKALEYWKKSNAVTPEKRAYVEKNFHLTPNSQSRLFRAKSDFNVAKKRLFRLEGGGRNVDEFWTKIEEKLVSKFKTRREMGCIVHRRHLVLFVYEICAELQINLDLEAKKRKWKSPGKIIRQRVDRFCKKWKIKMKRAARQCHKDPQVYFCT